LFVFQSSVFRISEKLHNGKQGFALTKKELQDLGVTKIPSSEKIQKRIENLESEQAATVREKQKLQKKQKTLDIIQQNFSVLLDAPEINSDLLPAKREPVSVTRDK
nr:hypothetical protein [Blautia wexlerae]